MFLIAMSNYTALFRATHNNRISTLNTSLSRFHLGVHSTRHSDSPRHRHIIIARRCYSVSLCLFPAMVVCSYRRAVIRNSGRPRDRRQTSPSSFVSKTNTVYTVDNFRDDSRPVLVFLCTLQTAAKMRRQVLADMLSTRLFAYATVIVCALIRSWPAHIASSTLLLLH